MPEVRVKICGLVRPDDARHAARAGADYLGAVLSAGFPRSVTPEVARSFSVAGGPPLVAVLLNEPVAAAAAKAEESGARILQLHGDEPPAVLAELRTEERWELWKAVCPRTVEELRRSVERYVELADGLLLDGWHPEHRGGGGMRFPWELLEAVRADFPAGLTLVAAGGLEPNTVADAVARLAPDVVDVSSGVEATLGQKDPGKVSEFIRSARGAVPLATALPRSRSAEATPRPGRR